MKALQLSSDFMALLPALRRYARALAGSQEVGDELVIKTLEWLGKSPAMTMDLEPRIALFRLLTQLWKGAIGQYIRERAEGSLQTNAADERLAQLDGTARQAFLLVAMEKFSGADAALILGISEEDFNSQIAIARWEIAQHVATDVLIIEDELFTAVELEMLVRGLGHRVSSKVRTHKEAVDAVRDYPPGLILADIQLADNSSGIEAVAEILQLISIPIIFITGCPERLLTGQRAEPTFLIKKPFKSDEVRALISQAIYFKQNATAASFAGDAVQKSLPGGA